MATLPISTSNGKDIFDGTTDFYEVDDSADRKVGGVYSHNQLEPSATQFQQFIDFCEYLKTFIPQMSPTAAPTVKATGTLAAANNGLAYQNSAAATYTLDAGYLGGTLYVNHADGITLTPPAGGIFRLGASQTSAAESVILSGVGTIATIQRVNAGEWWLRVTGNCQVVTP